MKTRRTLVSLALAAAFAPPALATDRAWICGSGNWNSASCWFAAGVPGAGDNVSILANAAVTYTGVANPVPVLNSLTVDSGANGSPNTGLTQTSGTLMAGTETFGFNGYGSMVQTGGTNTIATTLVVGAYGFGGSYDLSGSASLSAISEIIGSAGTGYFSQGGGTNAIAGALVIGDSSVYALSGGTLRAGSIAMGGSYSSTLIFNGGTLILTGTTIEVAELRVGEGSAGSLTVTSGMNVTTNHEVIGNTAGGSVTQVGGTHITPTMMLASATGVTGTYALSGGLLQVGTISKGAGTSTINVDGGTLQVTGGSVNVNNFNVGVTPGAVGSFALAAGVALTADNEAVNNGSFTQTGGSNLVAQALQIGGTGTGSYTLGAGTLTADRITGGTGTGTFNLDGGTLSIASGSIVATNFNVGNGAGSNGSFALASGMTLSTTTETLGAAGVGSIVQSGGANTTRTLKIVNGSYTLAGGTLTIKSALDNSDRFVLAGGAIGGGGALVNTGLLSGWGTLGGNGGFSNLGQFTQSGGTITLSNTGSNANSGNIDLASGLQLVLSGGALSNSGTLNLGGARVTGAAALVNAAGGTVAGRGSIAAPFSNAGSLVVSGGTLTVSNPWTNSGSIGFGDVASTLAGAAITNSGTLQGSGGVTSTVGNAGTVESINGVLKLGGALNNQASGMVRVDAGSKLLASGGIASNAGLISLAGGTLDTGGHALTSAGRITGYGVLASGGLTNNGVATFSGGTTTVNGSVTNAAVATMEVASSAAVFTDAVVNYGTFKSTQASVTFAGGYTEHGSYVSDPSTNNFTDLAVDATGSLAGQAGDVWNVSGRFANQSTQNQRWNTAAATLMLSGSALQIVDLAGVDRGALAQGYADNFAWGELALATGAQIQLKDGNAVSGAALYVGVLELAGGAAQIQRIASAYNIYYDASLAANGYLGDRSYALDGGGMLTPIAAVPEPATAGMLVSGLALMLAKSRRRFKRSVRVSV